MELERIFDERKDNPLYNTSYPIHPSDWNKYRVNAPLSFLAEKELSFYIHIPFCKQLCAFCEYTRMLCPDNNETRHYLDVIKSDIRYFKNTNKGFILKGFDIGGGTPTALSNDCFSYLLDIFSEAQEDISLSSDFEPSIEGTFQTLTTAKLHKMVDTNIHRLSLGIQTTNDGMLRNYHRKGDNLDYMRQWIDQAKNIGIRKINIDLMYGLQGQNEESILIDLRIIKQLQPEQVTLYELRTNMIGNASIPNKTSLYNQYRLLYTELMKLGYNGRFGQNTFSKNSNDFGVSSYLRSRMLDGASYKGFGIAAQSMCSTGIAYNVGKSARDISSLLKQNSYNEEYTYLLPPVELASKYIAIGGYSSSFSMKRLSEIFGCDATVKYKHQIDWCIKNEYINIERDRIYITPKGYKYYGAVLSLFFQ